MTRFRLQSVVWVALLLSFGLGAAACNADLFLASDNGRLTLQVFVGDDEDDDDHLALVIGGEPATVDVALVREGDTGPVNLTVGGVPEGVEVEIHHPGILNQGSVTLRATSAAAPLQDVLVSVTANDGRFHDFTQLTLDILP